MKIGQTILAILLTCVIALGILFLRVPPQSQNANAPTKIAKEETAYERIMRTGILRCGYIIFPAIIERDPNTGAFSGAFYEIVEELGKQLSLKIEWTEEAGFANAFEGVRTKRYDVVCFPFAQTPGRARVTEFTIPIAFWPFFAYVRADDTRFDNNYEKINDPSVKLAFLEGENSQAVRNQDFPKTQAVSLPSLNSISDVLMQVTTGKADITLTEPSAAEPFLVKNPGKLKRVLGPSLRMQPGGISVGVGEEALKSMLNTTLQAMINTGFVERVLEKNAIVPDQFFAAAEPWRPTPVKMQRPKQ